MKMELPKVFYEGDKNYTKSKLVVNYLNLPILFEYQTNRFSEKNSFHFGAGLLHRIKDRFHIQKMVYEDGKTNTKMMMDLILTHSNLSSMIRNWLGNH